MSFLWVMISPRLGPNADRATLEFLRMRLQRGSGILISYTGASYQHVKLKLTAGYIVYKVHTSTFQWSWNVALLVYFTVWLGESQWLLRRQSRLSYPTGAC